MKLRPKSIGVKRNRRLVIPSKLTPKVIRQKLLEGDERWFEKYQIIPPLKIRKIDNQKWKTI